MDFCDVCLIVCTNTWKLVTRDILCTWTLLPEYKSKQTHKLYFQKGALKKIQNQSFYHSLYQFKSCIIWTAGNIPVSSVHKQAHTVLYSSGSQPWVPRFSQAKILEALTTSCAGLDFGELESKNTWGPRLITTDSEEQVLYEFQDVPEYKFYKRLLNVFNSNICLLFVPLVTIHWLFPRYGLCSPSLVPLAGFQGGSSIFVDPGICHPREWGGRNEIHLTFCCFLDFPNCPLTWRYLTSSLPILSTPKLWPPKALSFYC